jgi:hypothetical protein
MFKWLVTRWRDYQTFRQTMREWLGEGGKPVDSEVSQARANQCLDCKFNRKSMLPDTFGGAFVRQLEAKKRMKLTVGGEELLHTCQLCRCSLHVKIFVPFKHIRQWQREQIRQAIIKGKSDCWQLNP